MCILLKTVTNITSYEIAKIMTFKDALFCFKMGKMWKFGSKMAGLCEIDTQNYTRSGIIYSKTYHFISDMI